jgi:hypothetical protein
MNDTARNDVLQKLHGRHQQLIAELESLEKRVDLALAATRPPAEKSDSTAPESCLSNARNVA